MLMILAGPASLAAVASGLDNAAAKTSKGATANFQLELISILQKKIPGKKKAAYTSAHAALVVLPAQ
jgi:hypothetical protein